MNRIFKWLIVPVLLIAITFIGVSLMKSKDKVADSPKKGGMPPKEKPLTKVDIFVVTPTKLADNREVSGSLLAYEEVDLKNEVAGRVVEINLPEGQSVKKGTLLVKLFDDDLQAGLRKLQIQLAIQEKIYERQAELVKVNGISQNDYEQTGLQLNSLRADIEIQKVLIRKTMVLAPFDGVIGLRNISIGAQVTPSTLLATIRSEDRLKLDFSVPEKYGSEIKPGMKINFTLSNNSKQYEATVMGTEEGIEAATRNLKVRAVVENKSEHLLPGAFADVFLKLRENNDALMIPTQAIIPAEQSKSVIMVRKGKAHFVTVKTGTREASTIEITEGLQPGDTIVTTGILFLKEGARLLYSTVKAQ